MTVLAGLWLPQQGFRAVKHEPPPLIGVAVRPWRSRTTSVRYLT